jgi:hypothetical protein
MNRFFDQSASGITYQERRLRMAGKLAALGRRGTGSDRPGERRGDCRRCRRSARDPARPRLTQCNRPKQCCFVRN